MSAANAAADHKIVLLLRRLIAFVAFGLLVLVIAAAIAGLSVERRAEFATTVGNLVAGVFVVSLPLMFGFGTAAMLKRTVKWLETAAYVSMASTGVSLFLLAAVPAIATKIAFDRDMRVTYGADSIRVDGAIAVDLARVLRQSMGEGYRPSIAYFGKNAGGDVQASQDAASFLIERGAARRCN